MYLTPTELREHVSTKLGDPALQRIIDGIEGEIHSRFGTLDPRVVRIRPAEHSRILVLPFRTRIVTEIVEAWASTTVGGTETTLDPADWRSTSSRTLERLGTGPNPAGAWSPWGVVVSAVPEDTSAVRKSVVLEVAKIDLAHSGFASRRIGEYAESTGGGQGESLDERREAIFARLKRARGLVIR